MLNDRLRIVVMGYIVRGPLGGFGWHHLQYVMGLTAMGHDVFFLEDSGEFPACYDPSRRVTGEDPTYGLQFTARCFEMVGLPPRWAYYDANREQWLGPTANSAARICAEADLLLDLSPMDPIRPWVEQIPTRVLIDTDPAFTQVEHLQKVEAFHKAQQHTEFFSFGENIGTASCSVPNNGFSWQPTRQPVVLEHWPVTPGPGTGKFTTVMQWDSYQALEYAGRSYGMKSASFGPYMDLPSRAGRILELALGSPTAPRPELSEKGWHLTNPLDISRDLDTYRSFIQRSKGEFSVAKHGYVATHSGWFSERSAVYLASGRPVLVQETGFSDWLPCGAGVLSFQTPDEAVAGIEEINSRYEYHQRAAREIAEEYFGANKVLTSLVERAMNETSAARRERCMGQADVL